MVSRRPPWNLDGKCRRPGAFAAGFVWDREQSDGARPINGRRTVPGNCCRKTSWIDFGFVWHSVEFGPSRGELHRRGDRIIMGIPSSTARGR